MDDSMDGSAFEVDVSSDFEPKPKAVSLHLPRALHFTVLHMLTIL